MTNNCFCIVIPLYLDVCFTMRIQPTKFNDIICRFYITHHETRTPIKHGFEYLSMKLYRCIYTNYNISTYKQALTSYRHFIECQIFAGFQASYSV
jgi:hypothetical protein